MDFYYESTGRKASYLVFDSKFTTLENLGRINGQGIKFITVQRRSKNLNEKNRTDTRLQMEEGKNRKGEQ